MQQTASNYDWFVYSTALYHYHHGAWLQLFILAFFFVFCCLYSTLTNVHTINKFIAPYEHTRRIIYVLMHDNIPLFRLTATKPNVRKTLLFATIKTILNKKNYILWRTACSACFFFFASQVDVSVFPPQFVWFDAFTVDHNIQDALKQVPSTK